MDQGAQAEGGGRVLPSGLAGTAPTAGGVSGVMAGWKTTPARRQSSGKTSTDPRGETSADPSGETGADATGETGAGATGETGASPGAETPTGVLDWLTVVAAGLDKSALEAMWAASDGDLEAAVGVLGVIRSVLERLEVAVAGEVDQRGLAGAVGLSTQDWLVSAFGAGAPKPEVRRIAQLVRVAQACRSERPTDVIVREAVTSGAMTVEKAGLVTRFVEDVRGLADPEALVADTEALVRAASDDQDGRALSTRELIKAIRYATQLIKPAADLEADERRRRLARSLVKGTGPAGMWDYRVRLDAEGAAILDAAVEALSAPVKGPDDERDPRPLATRRADALLEVIRRGVGAPGEMPTTENAQVIVTIPWVDLQDGCRGAGLTLTGELLSPAVLRRMACDARIFPMVLGAEGEVLDLGRGRRLFSPAQRKVIWRRDGQCTYPDCTIPAQWTDVQHIVCLSGPNLGHLERAEAYDEDEAGRGLLPHQ